MDSISVEITREDIIDCHPKQLDSFLKDKLNKGGITLEMLETGTLIQEQSLVRDSYIYTWKPK